MNKQIHGYVYMAVFNNPAAIIQSAIRWINSKQFLRWALLFSSSHLTPSYKGWRFKVLAFGAAIGTIMQFTCVCPTATTLLTQIAIVTSITVAVVFAWCLSRGYISLFFK